MMALSQDLPSSYPVRPDAGSPMVLGMILATLKYEW